jgi:hypothetical protein
MERAIAVTIFLDLRGWKQSRDFEGFQLEARDMKNNK